MNHFPLVSILISNYNCDRYLTSAIDSALAQTYPHTETIVVDDGSKDCSKNTIDSYGSKVTAIFQENGGQASAINTGFAASKGEIICLLDADDLWLPSKVEQVVAAFDNHPQAAVVYHRVQNIDATNTPIDKPWPPYKPIVGNISQSIEKTGGWWPFPPSTALSFSRQFLNTVMNIPKAEYQLCADAYLADLAPFFGEVVGIDRVLSQFRLHDANNWSKEKNQWQRAVEHDRIRIDCVNQTLNKHNLNFHLNLSDRWPYQWLQYKLGKEHNLWQLSRLAWQNPWEDRKLSKSKTLTKLWLEKLGVGSSRL